MAKHPTTTKCKTPGPCPVENDMTTFPAGLPDTASVRSYVGKSGTAEWHVVVHGDCSGTNPAADLEARWLSTLRKAEINPESTVFRRVFCSDIANQHAGLEQFARSHPGAFSTIGQEPSCGAKLAIWSYHIEDPENTPVRKGGGSSFVLQRGPLRHAWNTGLADPDGSDAGSQSSAIMENLEHWLSGQKLTLEDDVIRTWWFVRDIDADYPALVEARKAVFRKHGLNKHTHYIASTGIAGGHHAPNAKVSLDTYAIGGLLPGQIEFISAPDHLGPTYRYGVTFERATAVSYADRRHVFLSGTASIDPTGAIVHPGDAARQLERTLENVAALLTAAGAGMQDLAILIVYVRDPADGPMIQDLLSQHITDIPMVVVHGPVCRPGWLVEIEGIAWIPENNADFPEF